MRNPGRFHLCNKTVLFSVFGFLLALFAVASCKTETYSPVDEPYVLLLTDPDGTIDILQQPLKKEMQIWRGRDAAALEVEGTLRVEYDGDTYEYLQLTCPAALRCNGSKAYVPASLVYSYDATPAIVEGYAIITPDASAESAEQAPPRPFQLIKRAHLDEALALKAWMKDPGLAVPESSGELATDRLLAAHLESMPADARENKVAEWYFLGVSFEKALRNAAFTPYLKRYSAYPAIIAVATGKSSEEAGFAPGQDRFLRELVKFSQAKFERLAFDLGHDFPFQARNFAALATYYNDQLRLPLYKALIFKQILDDVPFEAVAPVEELRASAAPPSETQLAGAAPSASAGAAAGPTTGAPEDTRTPVVNVLYDLEFGAVVKYKTTTGATEERIFPKIQAVPHKNGLAFDLTTEGGEQLRVQPLKLSSFLAAANPDSLKKFRNKSPEEIMSADSYKRRVMLTALKYGVGDYDRVTRRFRYTIKMDDPGAYWPTLAVFKTAPAINVFQKDVYKGPLDLENPSMGDDDKLTCSQSYDKDSKASALKIAGNYTICERGCFDEQVDVACFDNSSSSEVMIEFPGKSLNAEEPEVDIHITANFGDGGYYAVGLCAQTLQAQYH